MSVQYASATGTSWAVTALPAFSLQPGQYFLVSENSNANVGMPLPTADASANIAMAAGAGKVLLSSVASAASGTAPTANVLDMVGYGTITGGTENPSTGALSATTSARRKLSCTDTNNNGADFAVVLPTPRNKGTALAPCGGAVTNPIVASCPTPLSLNFGSAGSVSGQFSGTVTFTNTSGSPISSPFQVEFSGLPSNVTLANATGSHNGVQYITAGSGTVAPGATVTLTSVFNNPTKGAIPYTATIFSGTY